MPLSEFLQWDWSKVDRYTPSHFQLIRDYFSPFDRRTGQLYPPDILSRIIVEYSQFFYGDPAPQQAGHYHIKTAVPEFHRNIYTDLANDYQFYYITSPSGFGKTTVATLVYPSYRADYLLDAYITVGGSTQQLSQEEHFRNIQVEFEENEKHLMVFGEYKPRTISRLTRTRPWNASEMTLPSGVHIRALGCMGRVRGRKRGAIRPTLIIIDDPEEAEEANSADLLKRHNIWLFRNVMYRIDSDVGKIRLIGNMLNNQCLMAAVKKDAQWRGVDYSALDSNDRSIWEDKWSTSYLLNERQLAIESGRYEEWMFERMNRPVAIANRKIDYTIADIRFERRNDQNLLHVNNFAPVVCTTWLGVDPEVAADEWGPRAFITLARAYFPSIHDKDKLVPATFMVNYLYRALSMNDIVDQIGLNHRQYFYSGVAIEANTWQIVFQQPIQDYMETDEFYFKNPFRLFPIAAQHASKVMRILKFQTPGARGELYINKDMPALKDDFDMVSIGKDKGLHLADAAEMAYRHSTPPAEYVRSYPGEDAHLDLRRHVPWKGIIQPANTAAKYDRHDNWKSIHLPKV